MLSERMLLQSNYGHHDPGWCSRLDRMASHTHQQGSYERSRRTDQRGTQASFNLNDQAAALTCCHLFIKDPICYQASNHSTEIVGDVIDKLLTVGIADPGTLPYAII